MSEYPDYEPMQPQRRDWRETIKRAFGPLIAGAIALAKFTFMLAKFGQHLHRGRRCTRSSSAGGTRSGSCC